MLRARTEGIVVHRAEVYSNEDYHFIVMKDGSIKPLCPLSDKGAHAIAYNGSTVGVAVFGDFAALEPGLNKFATPAQLTSTVALLQYINALYGMKLWVAGHSELGVAGTSVPAKLTYGHTCPGENFPLNDLVQKSGLRRWAPAIILAAK
jgi:N-acetyl-anhydromuramyl-L-alanine amidase AmpD